MRYLLPPAAMQLPLPPATTMPLWREQEEEAPEVGAVAAAVLVASAPVVQQQELRPPMDGEVVLQLTGPLPTAAKDLPGPRPGAHAVAATHRACVAAACSARLPRVCFGCHP